MNSFTRLTRLVITFAALLILLPNSSLALSWPTGCPDVATRGHLNVLTINLLFSEIKDREIRLENIANFMAEQAEEGEPVDIVLLQEIVGGPLSGTINSSLDLKKLRHSPLCQKNLSRALKFL
ncbi:MAG: hypothetical protein IMF11_06955 [Proteobacteria bacterium]|nr:hypothetical protein [Pseudomonadota bacterium]